MTTERLEWTPERESTLREAHARGASIRELETTTGMNRRQVWSRMARFGLSPNNSRPEKTIEGMKEALARRREALADAALADCENLRLRIWEEYEVVVSTPNGPERITLDLPDAKAVNDFANAINKLATTHENLERIGKARSADVQKSSINILFNNLAKVIAAQENEQ